MIEIRKDIVWWEWVYVVSNFWNFKRVWWKNRKFTISWTWYYVVSIKDKSWKMFTKKIHRLVISAFMPNTYSKPQINHIDWNKLNNNINNLERVTQSENMKHSYNVLKQKKPMAWRFWILNPHSKQIWQFINWEQIAIYYWCKEAERNTWIKWPNINKCCKWQLPHAWWYIWKYI